MLSKATTIQLPETTTPLLNNKYSLVATTILSSLLLAGLFATFGLRHAALFLVGLAAGVILYHAAFGFTAAWREIVSSGRGAGLRAQMVMLGVTVLVFTPLIAMGEVGGVGLRGSVAPLSVGVIIGAFMFGVGMQLGGGCASGTLFTAGGGNMRMVVTLLAFIAGSVIGSYHWTIWQDAPALPPVALSQSFGPLGGIVISLLLFTGIWFAAKAYEQRRLGSVSNDREVAGPYRFLRGPWPLLAGALALAGVNIATLLLAGRPWGVTSAFALWGAKFLQFVGVDVSQWTYWARPGSAESLQASVFADVTSVMNFGIILGALLAASLAHKYAPSFRIPWKSLLAAVVGGILLGYGARIAYGCNIGAYFGGISSTSLHGWLWFVAAFAGSSLGTRLRPWFGLQ